MDTNTYNYRADYHDAITLTRKNAVRMTRYTWGGGGGGGPLCSRAGIHVMRENETFPPRFEFTNIGLSSCVPTSYPLTNQDQRQSPREASGREVQEVQKSKRSDFIFHMDRNVRENFLPSDWSRVVNRATCSVN